MLLHFRGGLWQGLLRVANCRLLRACPLGSMILSCSVVLVGRKENVVRTTRPLTITLPSDMAQMVKNKVASGEYASESEVIRDGLRTLAQRDAAIERWLREEVVQTIAGVDEGTTQLMSLDEAKRRLHLHVDALAAKPRRS